jgi:hypothetical protein
MQSTVSRTEEIDSLSRDLCSAASEKGEAGASPPSRDRALYNDIARAYFGLRALGEAGLAELDRLLLNGPKSVQMWVGAQLLVEGNVHAEKVLESLALEKGILGLNAELTLREFRAGRLKSPLQVLHDA